MVCPVCKAFLQEDELIKLNLKKTGNVPIEYDARCPHCGVDIGKMHWGKLIPNPLLGRMRQGFFPGKQEQSGKPKEGGPPEPGGHPVCPHCGKTLPKNLSAQP